MTIPQAYFDLVQRQIDITRKFAIAWVDATSSASVAALARAAALGFGVAGRSDIERVQAARASEPQLPHPNVDDIFEEIVELMVVEDLTAAAR